MSRVSIIITRPINTLISGHIGASSMIQLDKQPGGEFILHGEKDQLVELLTGIKHHLLERKANARHHDAGTTEYYSVSLRSVQDALDSVNRVNVQSINPV